MPPRKEMPNRACSWDSWAQVLPFCEPFIIHSPTTPITIMANSFPSNNLFVFQHASYLIYNMSHELFTFASNEREHVEEQIWKEKCWVTTEKVSVCHQKLSFDFVCEQMEKRRHLMWKDRRWAWNKFKAIFLSPVSSLLYHYKYLYVVSQFKKYEGWILLHERVVSTRKNWMTNVCYNIDY